MVWLADAEGGQGSSGMDQAPTGAANTKRRQRGRTSSRNAARERSRVQSIQQAYQRLQSCLRTVPLDTKLSKLDTLVLAMSYITELKATLTQADASNAKQSLTPMEAAAGASTATHLVENGPPEGLMRPVKKWPMRSRLYSSVSTTECATCSCCLQSPLAQHQHQHHSNGHTGSRHDQ